MAQEFAIDRMTYPKAERYPQRFGYQLRGTQPSSIVVHSTEGPRDQSLENAARYLLTSGKVSAHYLIGRDGAITEFLHPAKYQAWHAGEAQDEYENSRSIGIELLHTRGETWPAVQKEALAFLLRKLMLDYRIPVTSIDTHGQIALPGPYKRKSDPTDWPRIDFLRWRATLAAPHPSTRYRARYRCAVYERSEGTGPVWGVLEKGEELTIDARYPAMTGHDALGRGFVRLEDVEPV